MYIYTYIYIIYIVDMYNVILCIHNDIYIYII